MRNILLILGLIFILKLIFTVICFILSPVFFVILVGIILLARSGLIAKLFHRSRKRKNDEIVIEVEPIKVKKSPF